MILPDAETFMSVSARVLPVIIFSAMAAATSSAKEKWTVCSAPDADFVLQIPAKLIHSATYTAGSCSFQTPDGEFSVEAIAARSSRKERNETLDARMQKETELLGGTVTYKKLGHNWFVLFGVTPDGTEYYRKLFMNDARWVTLRMTYPRVQHKKYGKWVARIDKIFVPFVIREAERGH